MIDFRIIINGQDLSRYVQEDNFPEYLEESLKGTGYFDYQVAPFSFKIYTGELSITFNRKDSVLFKKPTTGEILFRGFIDSIEDELTLTPSITVFPNALLLKDTVVGDLVDTGDDEEVYEFDTGGTIDVRSIVRQVLDDVNSKEGTNFNVSSTTCPDPPTTTGKKRFFGNVLYNISQSGFIWNIIQLIFGLTDGGEFREKAGQYYFVRRDAGIFKKTWIRKASWLNVKILGAKLKIPKKDIKITTIGAEYWVYKCIAGGLEFYKYYDFAPLPPFGESGLNLSAHYGNTISSFTAGNVNSKKVKSFIKEQGFNKEQDILSGFDLDDSNSYVLVKAKKKWKIWSHTLVLSFETTFDFYYRCLYRDATAMEILRDLVVVTDRWFYVDENDYVWLLPRDQSIEDVSLDRRMVLKLERKRHKEVEVDINVNRYEENDDQVASYGIGLRKNEYEAIRKYYREKFQGERIEDTIKILNPPSNTGLMKKALINNENHGIIIGLNRSFLEPITEIKAEQYV